VGLCSPPARGSREAAAAPLQGSVSGRVAAPRAFGSPHRPDSPRICSSPGAAEAISLSAPLTHRVGSLLPSRLPRPAGKGGRRFDQLSRGNTRPCGRGPAARKRTGSVGESSPTSPAAVFLVGSVLGVRQGRKCPACLVRAAGSSRHGRSGRVGRPGRNAGRNPDPPRGRERDRRRRGGCRRSGRHRALRGGHRRRLHGHLPRAPASHRHDRRPRDRTGGVPGGRVRRPTDRPADPVLPAEGDERDGGRRSRDASHVGGGSAAVRDDVAVALAASGDGPSLSAASSSTRPSTTRRP